MSSFQKKIYDYEQVPPGKVWDRIAAALDESHIGYEFPSRLHDAAVVPPATTWNRISDSLEETRRAAIPLKRKRPHLVRYAVAASFLGILAFAIIRLTEGKNHSADNHSIAVSKTGNTVDGEPLTEAGITNSNKAEKSGSARSSETMSIAAVDHAGTASLKKTGRNFRLTNDNLSTEPVYAYNEHDPALLADRYVMLMTPNGIIRMSKKLGDLVCCVSGQEQNQDCKDQLKKWQEKIATAPVAPSPGNFMDILSLVSSLSDKDL